MNARDPLVTPLIIFISFLLLFLACISVPFAQSIRIFTLVDHQSKESIAFGLWGYCLSGRIDDYPQCSVSQAGWTFNDVPTLSGLQGAISARLTGALLINPFVTTFIFVIFLLSLLFVSETLSQHESTHASRTKYYILPHRTTLTFQAALGATLALVADAIVISIIKQRVHKAAVTSHTNFTVSVGSLIWLVLSAALILWTAAGMQLRDRLRDRTRNMKGADPEGLKLVSGSLATTSDDVELSDLGQEERELETADEHLDPSVEGTQSDHEHPLDDEFADETEGGSLLHDGLEIGSHTGDGRDQSMEVDDDQQSPLRTLSTTGYLDRDTGRFSSAGSIRGSSSEALESDPSYHIDGGNGSLDYQPTERATADHFNTDNEYPSNTGLDYESGSQLPETGFDEERDLSEHVLYTQGVSEELASPASHISATDSGLSVPQNYESDFEGSQQMSSRHPSVNHAETHHSGDTRCAVSVDSGQASSFRYTEPASGGSHSLSGRALYTQGLSEELVSRASHVSAIDSGRLSIPQSYESDFEGNQQMSSHPLSVNQAETHHGGYTRRTVSVDSGQASSFRYFEPASAGSRSLSENVLYTQGPSEELASPASHVPAIDSGLSIPQSYESDFEGNRKMSSHPLSAYQTETHHGEDTRRTVSIDSGQASSFRHSEPASVGSHSLSENALYTQGLSEELVSRASNVSVIDSGRLSIPQSYESDFEGNQKTSSHPLSAYQTETHHGGDTRRTISVDSVQASGLRHSEPASSGSHNSSEHILYTQGLSEELAGPASHVSAIDSGRLSIPQSYEPDFEGNQKMSSYPLSVNQAETHHGGDTRRTDTIDSGQASSFRHSEPASGGSHDLLSHPLSMQEDEYCGEDADHDLGSESVLGDGPMDSEYKSDEDCGSSSHTPSMQSVRAQQSGGEYISTTENGHGLIPRTHTSALSRSHSRSGPKKDLVHKATQADLKMSVIVRQETHRLKRR
ncbi:hypothetical protein M0805_006061 [Coniferiporia weirii]|nr:hypothetical protein M0805_006061 [Coniferiporia weirii]